MQREAQACIVQLPLSAQNLTTVSKMPLKLLGVCGHVNLLQLIQGNVAVRGRIPNVMPQEHDRELCASPAGLHGEVTAVWIALA
eukprot:CAMPEP_0174364110 /NCGR_PEP_ID=MMETSP0811_2-20130205/71577_1 /TAXON_ID=73025 ORGANISM="Eutreptiella gymnastica-like, Strain CCMP1594" /NCGR_SAMPLE_ID=MMETSP0811_2 /ASSEMBLY_ACC=CAM_ASM_000667 /LENGTH=83 /DNA_ID=CAMNT_0015503453 /DNA_START=314 /DNA_END=562 /DNA_ORIENTATION=+